jgi:nucleotide-binding universal stress UspA family protein
MLLPSYALKSFLIQREQMKASNLKPRKQPSRILVAVDGSDTSMNAAEYAITLAKNYDDDNGNNEAVEVFVLNVIDLPPIFKMLPSETRKQLTRIGRQQANQIFDTIEEIAKHHSAQFKTNTEMVETSSASAADEIIKYAKEKEIDLIVVGTKGRSAMRKALLGSVASKVVTYSPCSVLVVR